MSEKTLPPNPEEAKAVATGGRGAHSPDSILQEIAKLQKQLLKGISFMDELMSTHAPNGTALQFLKNHPILLPQTEQFFRRKLQILQQHTQQGKANKGVTHMLGKLKAEIHNSLKIDTQFFILKETLKSYEGQWELTQEEAALIPNMEIPTQRRGVFVELCRQKYHFLHELQSFIPDPERLEALQLENASPLVINILQDILKQQPFYFSKEELESFENFVPKAHEGQIKWSRKHSFELYQQSIGSALFSKLVHWGFWKMEARAQNHLIATLKQNFKMDAHEFKRWNHFKSLRVSKKPLEKIARSIPPKVEEIIDEKGKSILSNIRTVLFKNDEAGMKNIRQQDIEYLADSLTTTDYIAKIQTLLDSFTDIAPPSASDENPNQQQPPTSKFTQQFHDILNMEFHDQRLELLLDALLEILPPGSPVMETGKQLYKNLTGFDY